MAMLPMLMYGLEVPAGDVAISARPDVPAAFRITMAAIDPSAAPEGEENVLPRATLKILRQPLRGYDFDDDSEDDEDDSEDFDADEMERMLAEGSDEDSDDEVELNGGPSNPAKSKQAKRAAAEKAIEKLLEEEGIEVDEEELPNGVNGSKKSAKAKGKMPASDEDDDELDEDEDDEDGDEIEEFVICTLDPTKTYQQPLDITIGEDEKVWFQVSGTHTIYLTGNYVEPASTRPDLYDEDEDDEEDYDLEPDMDEIENEDDMLDELEDPRITELDDDDAMEAPALVKVHTKKTNAKAGNKNKRRAEEDSDDDDAGEGAQTIDELISKASAAIGANGDAKLSKKQLKKLKKNDGAAAAAPAAKPAEADSSSSNKSDKKVSFAKQLEQGPTPTKAGGKEKPTGSLGVKVIQGVTIDDKKLGTGQAAKNGDRVSMRYIGKLQKDNQQFDSNKTGKPFGFKLGSGEVIKGWDIGVAGMTAGGERRITIPAHLGYGSKGLPGIPSNSALIFDVKLLNINKGK